MKRDQEEKRVYRKFSAEVDKMNLLLGIHLRRMSPISHLIDVSPLRPVQIPGKEFSD